MSTAVARVALVLLLVLGGLCEEKNPITKVVELIEELKATVISDGKIEENTYNKMACWCETTTENKAKEIADGQSSLADLSSSMNTNKGTIASLASDINDLMSEVSAAEAYKYRETTKRERQNADFMQNKAELANAVGALDKAVQMLTGFDELSFIQGGAKLSNTQRQVLRAVKPAVEKALAALSDSRPAPVSQLAALEKAVTTMKLQYTPFEPTITSILKDLLESFRATAETEANNENDLQSSYEELMQTKTDQLTAKKETVANNEALKAEEAKQMSENELQWQSTADTVTAANNLFAAAKQACTKKAEDWKARKAAREEELKGINAALATLTSDESRALVNKAANDGPGGLDFLQVGSNNAEEARLSRAYQALHGAAVRVKSFRLARIAKSVLRHQHQEPSPNKDAWKEPVVKGINEMIADLAVEQEEDTVSYGNCKEEQQKLQLEIENRTHIIKRHTIKLDQLSTKIEDLQKGIEEASQDVEDIVEMQATMLKEREDENKEFEQEKNDDEGALKVLEKAIDELSAFYHPTEEAPAAMLQEDDSDEDENDEGENAGESLVEEGSKRLRGFHGGSERTVGVHIGAAKTQKVTQKAAAAVNQTQLEGHVDRLASHVGMKKASRKGKAEKRTAQKVHKNKGLSWKSKKADPVFEVSNDDMLKKMDDHSLSEQQSRSGAAGGIVSLLTVIKEDLQSDIQKSIKIEKESLDEYEKMKEDSDTEKEDLEHKIDDYRGEKSDAEETANDTNNLKEGQEEEFASAEKEMLMLMSKGDSGKHIHLACEFMIGNYHPRRLRRDAEVEGLKEGIAFLNGMA